MRIINYNFIQLQYIATPYYGISLNSSGYKLDKIYKQYIKYLYENSQRYERQRFI